MSLRKFTSWLIWLIVTLQVILVLVSHLTLNMSLGLSYREKNETYAKILPTYIKHQGIEKGIASFTNDTGAVATYFEYSNGAWVRKFTSVRTEIGELAIGTPLEDERVIEALCIDKVYNDKTNIFNKTYLATYRTIEVPEGDNYVLFVGTDITEPNRVIKKTFIELVILSFLVVSVGLVAFKIIIEHFTRKK